MKYNKTILVLYAEPIEAFSDGKRFCAIKGMNYNTFKQKRLPMTFKGAKLVREVKGEVSEYTTINGNLVKIQ